MRKLLVMTTAVLALLVGGISLALPSQAATSASLFSKQVQAPVQTAGDPQAAETPTPTSESSASATPSGNPVNPGTGEPAESEGARLDWAPYVIGAIVLGAILAAVLWRRRRHDKTVV